MARAGRKRKITLREPSGKVQRVYENPRHQVTMQPHRVVLPAKFRETQEAGSEFGRLMIMGCISAAQYEAGKRYSDLAATYLAAINAPSPNPAALNLDRIGLANYEGMPDHIARVIKVKYDSAYESLGNKAGHRSQRAVAHHAVQDRKLSSVDDLVLLTHGLNALVAHFGIDRNLQITDRPK